MKLYRPHVPRMPCNPGPRQPTTNPARLHERAWETRPQLGTFAYRDAFALPRIDGFIDPPVEPPIEQRDERRRMQGLVAMVGVVLATLLLATIGLAIGFYWQADDRAERAEWGIEAPR